MLQKERYRASTKFFDHTVRSDLPRRCRDGEVMVGSQQGDTPEHPGSAATQTATDPHCNGFTIPKYQPQYGSRLLVVATQTSSHVEEYLQTKLKPQMLINVTVQCFGIINQTPFFIDSLFSPLGSRDPTIRQSLGSLRDGAGSSR